MSNRPLRVLQVTASVARADGGPATAIVELNRHLRQRGVDSTILTTDADGAGHLTSDERARIARDSGSVQIYRMHWPRRLKASLGLARALRREIPDADVLHIHGLYLFHTAVACRMARRRGVPHLVQPHGSLEPYQRAQHTLRKQLVEPFAGVRVAQCAARVVFTDASEADRAIDIVDGSRACVVPLGARLEPTTDADRPTFWRDDFAGRPIVLFLGRLARKKRVDLLIEAWPEVLRKQPDAMLLLVGPDDPANEQDLRAAAASLPPDSIMFAGPVHGAGKTFVMQNCTAFALPSENENFAIAVAEAFQACLPVMVSDNVATHTAVERHGAGVVIRALEPHVVAAGLLALLDAQNRPRFVWGCEQAASELTWSASAASAEACYRSAIRRQE